PVRALARSRDHECAHAGGALGDRPARHFHLRAGDRARDRDRSRRATPHRHHRAGHEHRVLRPRLHALCFSRAQPRRIFRFRHPGHRRRDRRTDGALRIEGHSRTWNPRGDGAGVVERGQDPGARHASQAAVVVGALVGWLSVYVTRAVYWIEDLFEHLPVHWMWWPAIGGLAVGIVGYYAPRTLGVGYDNLDDLVSGKLIGTAVLMLAIMKFLSWSISLGSGTSGGTLAPLFTIGGACGVVLGQIASTSIPRFGIDVRICALVGMAAMFAGASRAL